MENKLFKSKTSSFCKKHSKEFIGPVISLILACFIGILPGFFYFPIVLVTIPLFILPNFLGLHLIICSIEEKRDIPPSLTLCGFPPYFGYVARGCYRAILGCIKGIGFFMIGLFLTTIIYVPIATAVEPEFNECIEALYQASMLGDLPSVTAYLDAPSMVRYFVTCFIVGSYSFLLIFFRHLEIHQLNVVYRLHIVDDHPDQYLPKLFVKSYSRLKHEIRRDIRGVSWIGLCVFSFGFLLGGAIGMLINGYSLIVPICAVLGAFIGVSCFLPYYARYANLVWYYYSIDLQAYIIDAAAEEITTIKELHLVNDSELAEIEKEFEENKAIYEERAKNFDRNAYPFE